MKPAALLLAVSSVAFSHPAFAGVPAFCQLDQLKIAVEAANEKWQDFSKLFSIEDVSFKKTPAKGGEQAESFVVFRGQEKATGSCSFIVGLGITQSKIPCPTYALTSAQVSCDKIELPRIDFTWKTREGESRISIDESGRITHTETEKGDTVELEERALKGDAFRALKAITDSIQASETSVGDYDGSAIGGNVTLTDSMGTTLVVSVAEKARSARRQISYNTNELSRYALLNYLNSLARQMADRGPCAHSGLKLPAHCGTPVYAPLEVVRCTPSSETPVSSLVWSDDKGRASLTVSRNLSSVQSSVELSFDEKNQGNYLASSEAFTFKTDTDALVPGKHFAGVLSGPALKELGASGPIGMNCTVTGPVNPYLPKR
jgi:hypothetical protein